MSAPVVGQVYVSTDKRDKGRTVRVLQVGKFYVWVTGSRVSLKNWDRLYRPLEDK